MCTSIVCAAVHLWGSTAYCNSVLQTLLFLHILFNITCPLSNNVQFILSESKIDCRLWIIHVFDIDPFSTSTLFINKNAPPSSLHIHFISYTLSISFQSYAKYWKVYDILCYACSLTNLFIAVIIVSIYQVPSYREVSIEPRISACSGKFFRRFTSFRLAGGLDRFVHVLVTPCSVPMLYMELIPYFHEIFIHLKKYNFTCASISCHREPMRSLELNSDHQRILLLQFY